MRKPPLTVPNSPIVIVAPFHLLQIAPIANRTASSIGHTATPGLQRLWNQGIKQRQVRFPLPRTISPMNVVFLLPAPIVPSHFDLIVPAPQRQTRMVVQTHRLRQHLRLHRFQKIGCIGIHRTIEHQILPNHDPQGIASLIKRIARIRPTAPNPNHVVALPSHNIEVSHQPRLTQKQSLRIQTSTVAKLPGPNHICTLRKNRNSIYGKRKSSARSIQCNRPHTPIRLNIMNLVSTIFIQLMRRNLNIIQSRMRILIHLLIQPIG